MILVSNKVYLPFDAIVKKILISSQIIIIIIGVVAVGDDSEMILLSNEVYLPFAVIVKKMY